jgi:hypothetical protein
MSLHMDIFHRLVVLEPEQGAVQNPSRLISVHLRLARGENASYSYPPCYGLPLQMMSQRRALQVQQQQQRTQP